VRGESGMGKRRKVVRGKAERGQKSGGGCVFVFRNRKKCRESGRAGEEEADMADDDGRMRW